MNIQFANIDDIQQIEIWKQKSFFFYFYNEVV